MEPEIDVLIVGGGLAGLTAAIHLMKIGLKVTLIEKNAYPHHKVCGEYVSNEVLPYLQWLGANPLDLKPSVINKFQLSSASGKSIKSSLPLGGFGLSRYLLDNFLYSKAKDAGCTIVEDAVNDISFLNDRFKVSTLSQNSYKARLVIGAYGKRNGLDYGLNRSFIKKKAPWLAIKAHYKGDFPDNLVAIHNFRGGYCGISKIEDDKINICYLVDYATFKTYKSVTEHQQKVLFQNHHLKHILEQNEILFEAPLAIGQVSFEKKEAVKDHILMIGDTAGLIHPLCGNGMGMAVHSAKIVVELIAKYFNGEINSRSELERRYTKAWHDHFRLRLITGKYLSGIL